MPKYKKIYIYGLVDAPNKWKAEQAFNELEATGGISDLYQNGFVKEDEPRGWLGSLKKQLKG